MVVSLPPAQAIAARYSEAVVSVAVVDSKVASQGFFASSSGLTCTVLPGVKVGARVVVQGDSTAYHGMVVIADDDGLALVALDEALANPITALGVRATAPVGWLVGLQRDAQRGVEAVVGGEETSPDVLLVPVARGAPILRDDTVVAIARKSLGGGRVTIIPASRIQALAKRYAAREKG